MTKCTLWGGYAGGNVGDELTLAIALRDMQAIYPNNVTIISHSVEYTKWLFPRTEVVQYKKLPFVSYHFALHKWTSRFDILTDFFETKKFHSWMEKYIKYNFDWVKSIKNSQLLYLVGGGYLTDLFNIHSFLLPVYIAKEFGVRISTAPLGIGPFAHKKSINLFKRAFKDANICVRDQDSLLLCEMNGLHPKLLRDDGFRIEELSNIDIRTTKKDNIPNVSSKIGICAHNQQGSLLSEEEYFLWWVNLLQLLIDLGLQKKIEGFCFHNSLKSDFSFLVKVFTAVGLDPKKVLEPSLDYFNAINQLKKYNYIITTRFHAAVLANVYQIRTLAIYSGNYYRNKMLSAIDPNQGSRASSIEESNPINIADSILQCI